MKTKTKKSQPKQKKLAPGWQHGNVSLIVLIIVIVAIVAGGVGWMLARNTQVSTNKSAVSQLESISQIQPDEKQLLVQSSTFPNQENNQTYFEIIELGLKFPVNQEVANDIRYEIQKGNNLDSYAILSSKKLIGKELEGCVTSVNLLKNTGIASDHPDFMSAFPAKQFDGFFVTAAGPQDMCSDDMRIKKMEIEFVENIITGLKDVRIIN